MGLNIRIIHLMEDFPRIDYRLSIGEDPHLERITPENAYDLPYIRLVYRQVHKLTMSWVYELWSVELVS